MRNILTVDLEDYFQVHAFSRVVQFEDWCKFECRIERNTDRLLEVLNSVPSPRPSKSLPCAMPSAPCESTKATFFVLGWIAERYPGLVRRIQKEGHEIACHGYAHRLIYSQSREEFREDIKKSKTILQDITGSEVMGYRAPSYSITNKSRWAFEILAEEGFRYDSSIFPIHHDFYGMPNAPRFPFIISLNRNNNFEFSTLNFQFGTAAPQHRSTATPPVGILPQSPLDTRHSLVEFPLSTAKVFGQNFPISGGGYFRLLPYPLVRYGLKRINEKENKPFTFYLHPWEIDPEQPRIKTLSSRSTFRHYVNLDKTELKLKRLLSGFRFSSIKEFLRDNDGTETQ
jgi:polysaccharide deacetylase family protein (PEP-CTERM system associated)